MNNKTIIRFFVSRLCAALADQILLFAVPIIIYKSTGSVMLSGLIFFIEWAPRVLSLPIAGTLSDRLGGKRVYVTADLVRGITCALAFCTLFNYTDSQFLALAMMMAICAFFYAQSYIAMESIIPQVFDKNALSKVQAWLQAVEQGSMIVGPSIGALGALYFDEFNLVAVCSVLFLFAGYLMLDFKLGAPTIGVEKPSGLFLSFKRDVVTSLSIMKSRPNLIFLILLSVCVNLVIGLLLATGAILTTGYFDRSSSDFGLLQSIAGLVTVFSLALIPAILRRINIFYLGISGYLAIAAAAVSISVIGYFWLYVSLYASIVIAANFFNIYIRTERALCIPKEHLGKTIGVIVFLNQLALPLSGLLVSIAGTEQAAKNIFLGLGFFAMVVFVIVFTRLRTHSRALEVA